MNTNHNKYFSSLGFISSGFFNLTSKEAYNEAINTAFIVDVREEFLIGYKRFDVPSVIYIPFSQLKNRVSELPLNHPLIIADTVGLHSNEAMNILLSKGFENIANLAGGILEWERDNLPLIINRKEQLSGACMCQLKPRNK